MGQHAYIRYFSSQLRNAAIGIPPYPCTKGHLLFYTLKGVAIWYIDQGMAVVFETFELYGIAEKPIHELVTVSAYGGAIVVPFNDRSVIIVH